MQPRLKFLNPLPTHDNILPLVPVQFDLQTGIGIGNDIFYKIDVDKKLSAYPKKYGWLQIGFQIFQGSFHQVVSAVRSDNIGTFVLTIKTFHLLGVDNS